MKHNGRSLLALMIAVVLTGLGVALFLHANLGSDTITVLIDGLRTSLPLSLGEATLCYNLGALTLAFLLSRKDIGWTSIMYACSTGFTMDLFDRQLLPLAISVSPMLIRILSLCIGQLCIIVSFTLLIRYGTGMDQLDAIAYGLARRCTLPYAWIRTGLDIVMIVTGASMGGVIGIGSVFAMSTTGFGVKWMLDHSFQSAVKRRRL